MRSTLFFIPHAIGPLPVFGWGWLLVGIAVAFTCVYANRLIQGRSLLKGNGDGLSWLIATALIVLVVPRMESVFPDGQGGSYVVGLPIRGYGLFLMSGVVGAVWLTSLRSKKQGLALDGLMSLSVTTVIGGLLGARIFFVVQKWSELHGTTFFEKLLEAFKFTEGGLVVFGSFIGGALAVIWWSLRRRYRLLVMGDLIVAGLMLGLCLGRLGCFMNGCCYGGICEREIPAVTFPSGTLPYMDQLYSGRLLGMKLDGDPTTKIGGKVISVQPSSWAADQDVQVGGRVASLRAIAVPPEKSRDPAGPWEIQGEVMVNDRLYRLDEKLPPRSLPTHPAQLYASLNAGLICAFLFTLWPNVRRDGIVLGAWLILCGSSRILEESIRIDEGGQFGTSLTIAQWISIVGIIGGCVILLYVSFQPVGRRPLVT